VKFDKVGCHQEKISLLKIWQQFPGLKNGFTIWLILPLVC
jgi:hypothetical protein